MIIKEEIIKNTGLRGVKVADTKVSYIDGVKGVLIYRGYRIEDLAEKSPYDETAYLLLKGKLPSPDELKIFKKKLASLGKLPQFLIDSMNTWPKETTPMKALMASVSMLAFNDDINDNESIEVCEEKSIKLMALLPVAVATWHRIRNGLAPIQPDEELSFAENFLYQLSGEKSSKEIVDCFDKCLILHADHTFNASTFACREVVSTKADIYAGVLAGLSALSGPLHGGANEKVMDMLLSLQDEPDPEQWTKNMLTNGQKIMGLAHAVYKTEDPRAVILKAMGKRLGVLQKQTFWCDLLEKIEKASIEYFTLHGKNGIKPNVDYYSAPVYHLIGLPKELFTPVFAISRAVGWCAHMIEEKFGMANLKPALYRPSADYVGKYCGLTGCEYKPMENRATIN